MLRSKQRQKWKRWLDRAKNILANETLVRKAVCNDWTLSRLFETYKNAQSALKIPESEKIITSTLHEKAPFSEENGALYYGDRDGTRTRSLQIDSLVL